MPTSAEQNLLNSLVRLEPVPDNIGKTVKDCPRDKPVGKMEELPALLVRTGEMLTNFNAFAANIEIQMKSRHEGVFEDNSRAAANPHDPKIANAIRDAAALTAAKDI